MRIVKRLDTKEKKEHVLNQIAQYLDRNNGTYYTSINIKRVRPTRTNEQNALLFGAVYPQIQKYIFDELTEHYTVEDIHEFFKSKFVAPYKVKILGEEIKTARSTTDLDTKEFSKYIDNIQRYCAVTYGMDINLDDTD